MQPAPRRPAYSSDGGYRPVRRPPSSPVAVAGIVSGATALVLLVLTAGTSFMLCLIASVLALVCSNVARRRMDEGQPGRRGQIRTARILGIAGLALSLVAIVTWIVLSEVAGFTPADLLRELERFTERQASR